MLTWVVKANVFWKLLSTYLDKDCKNQFDSDSCGYVGWIAIAIQSGQIAKSEAVRRMKSKFDVQGIKSLLPFNHSKPMYLRTNRWNTSDI